MKMARMIVERVPQVSLLRPGCGGLHPLAGSSGRGVGVVVVMVTTMVVCLRECGCRKQHRRGKQQNLLHDQNHSEQPEQKDHAPVTLK